MANNWSIQQMSLNLKKYRLIKKTGKVLPLPAQLGVEN
jgi:hypothetical protein